MQSDLPHTLYLPRDKNGRVKAKVNKDDKAFALQQQALQRAEERRKAKMRGEAPITMNELFKK